MGKIKVIHHSKTVGYSGTDRTAQLFTKYLANSEKYEPYLLYREGDAANTRLDFAREWIGDENVISYTWKPGKKSGIAPYLPEEDDFADVVKMINPSIFHIHRSGYHEWPGMRYLMPNGCKMIETNIFGYKDASNNIDLSIYVSDFISCLAESKGAKDGVVLYNPVEIPFVEVSDENRRRCRKKLTDRFDLPTDAVIMGRVGRADNFDPIALRALKHANNPRLHYIVVNGCDRWRYLSSSLGLKNVHFVEPIIDDRKLSEFYLGLDIYAHARHDGECCPCNIQEAMIHGVTPVSHKSRIYNGQEEIIGDAGFVVPLDDYVAYGDILNELAASPILRIDWSKRARRRAMRLFEASCVTSTLEGIYDWTLENR